ncbi:MAG: 3-dehydroquinate synthase [Phocaeicola sp.]|uniref:3-dehydroquinate synthase n=1 Tax=Phocaeicola sp. TaxID=2773926 RepID=UPI003FA01F94
MQKQEVLFTHNIEKDLEKVLFRCTYDKLFLLTDESTLKFCAPIVQNFECLKNADIITIPTGDLNKNLQSMQIVWNALDEMKASRRSLMINLGGGMVTDLGGFAASTFKRGIPFVNIPTTLLAMVDASVGGKTGINFNGLKNEIGVFNTAESVIIYPDFLKTLDTQNLLSGYAEMLKHGLISNVKHWAELLNFDWNKPDYKELLSLIEQSVLVKEKIVEEDPHEHGIRKALNFGHTIGHAFESWSMERNHPILHGYAVAFGLVCELYFSYIRLKFPQDKLQQTNLFIKEHYGTLGITCKQYDKLYELITHDKKNTNGVINFTLLSDIGDVHINQQADKKEIFEIFDFFQDAGF